MNVFFYFGLILRKAPDGSELPSGRADALEISELAPELREKIEVNLSWSELFNEKWQPRKTSNFDDPMDLGAYSITGENKFIQKWNCAAKLSIEESGLRISIENNKEYRDFKLPSKHSSPVKIYPKDWGTVIVGDPGDPLGDRRDFRTLFPIVDPVRANPCQRHDLGPAGHDLPQGESNGHRPQQDHGSAGRDPR